MKDKELFPEDDQAGWLPPDISKIFGEVTFTKESILKSGFYIPTGKIDEEWPLKITWEENKTTTNEQQ